MKASLLSVSETGKELSKENLAPEDDEKPIPSYPKYKFYKWEFETPIVWTNVFLITLWHIIAIYGYITHPYLESPGIVFYNIFLAGFLAFGTAAGVHRYYTHRSYKAKLPLRIILLICYSLTGQYTVVQWVRDHRVHHKFTETDADPHNAKRGFFFSHVGWLMMRRHPEVIRKGRTVDISDVLEDPLVVFHQKYFVVLTLVFCFIIPTVIPPFLYGETWYTSILSTFFMKYVTFLNITWTVNSVAHLWGKKPYDEKINPTDNLAVSFFTVGEGYHNYHHTFPWDYRTSEAGKLFTLTTFWLNVFAKIGWAYDLKFPSEELIKKVVQNNGDGSHYRWGHEVPISENDAIKLKET